MNNANLLIVVRPNASLSVRGNAVVFAILCAYFAAMGIYMFSLGAWLVLPFAGLELLAFYLGTRAVLRARRNREVIRVDEQQVVVEYGRHMPERVIELPRYAARVKLHQQAERVEIVTWNARCVVGEMLPPIERRSLARRLGAVLGWA